MNHSRVRLLTILLTVSYPIALHLCILQGELRAAIWLLLVISSVHALLGLITNGPVGFKQMVMPILAVLAAVGLYLDDAAALYIPPILINSMLLVVFGRTLLPGETPLISQFARRVEMTPDKAELRYTAGVTWIWTLFFFAMLIEAILLALYAPIEIWSLFTNLINYFMMAGLFLLELLVRIIRFRRIPSISRLKEIFRHRE